MLLSQTNNRVVRSTTPPKRVGKAHGYWTNMQNQVNFFQMLQLKLKLKWFEDWYKVKISDIIKNGGKGLLKHYDGSPSAAIQAVYPEYPWKLWLFDKVPNGCWKNVENQKQFLDWLAKELKITKPDDWYKVTAEDISKQGGAGLLNQYNNSPSEAIKNVYPNYPWKDWLFEKVQQDYWNQVVNQKQFLDWLGEQLNVKQLEDWYKVTPQDIIQNGGKGLLNFYDGCFSAAILAIYPEFQWKVWLFEGVQVPRGYWSTFAHQKQFFDWLGQQLNITTPEDWYKVTVKDIYRLGGRGLLDHYHGSPSSAIQTVYPEYPWQLSLFDKVPQDHWKQFANQRQFFDWLGGVLGVTKLEDWYQINRSDIIQNGGGFLENYYGGSPSRAIQSIYPEYPWKMWLFDKVPLGYWKDTGHQRQFFDWLGGQLKITSPEGWYKVTQQCIIKTGGIGLLNHYEGSLNAAVQAVYPEYPWKVWLFDKVPNDYWSDIQNQRQFFDWLAEQLKITTPEEWYRVNRGDICKQGGSGLLTQHYNGSLSEALKAIYPEDPWKLWLFDGGVPQHYWERNENQREFFNWLGEQLGLKKLEDWYKVKAKDISKHGGFYLLRTQYNNAPSVAIQAVYPEYPWKVWLFDKVPKNYWTDKQHQRQFFDWLREQLHIKHYDDWYKVKAEDIYSRGGTYLMKLYGSYFEALMTIYPHYPWRFEQNRMFVKGKAESYLHNVLGKIFPPHTVIHFKYRHPKLVYSGSSSHTRMELDAFVPEYDLAFEYQVTTTIIPKLADTTNRVNNIIRISAVLHLHQYL